MDRLQTTKQLIEQGKTVKEIGEYFGLTKGGMTKFFRKHDLKTKRSQFCNPDGSFTKKPFDSVLTFDEANRLYIDQKLSTNEIAKIKGCTSVAVKTWLKKFGIKTRAPEERQKICRERYGAGMGFQQREKNPCWNKSPAQGSDVRGKRQFYKGILFKSSYEVAFAKWCDENNKSWSYEPQRFVLKTLTYAPDFLVDGKWYEIKGWLTPRGSLAIDEFRECGHDLAVLFKKDLIKMGVLWR